jgi:hypothetical protein
MYDGFTGKEEEKVGEHMRFSLLRIVFPFHGLN